MSKNAMLQQQELFAADSTATNTLRELCRSLPALPLALRYYDEFDDKIRSIKNPAAQAVFEISIFGKNININFGRLGEECSYIFKHVFSYVLAQDLAVISAVGYLSSAQHLTPTDVAALIESGPTKIGHVWKTLRARELPT